MQNEDVKRLVDPFLRGVQSAYVDSYNRCVEVMVRVVEETESTVSCATSVHRLVRRSISYSRYTCQVLPIDQSKKVQKYFRFVFTTTAIMVVPIDVCGRVLPKASLTNIPAGKDCFGWFVSLLTEHYSIKWGTGLVAPSRNYTGWNLSAFLF